MAHHDRSMCERVITLVEQGVLSARAAGERYGNPRVHGKSMVTEIPDGWTSWKAPRIWVMARIECS
jgi:hypothetical protein